MGGSNYTKIKTMKTAINKNLIKADLFRILSMGFSYPDQEKCDDIDSIINDLSNDGDLDPEIQEYLRSIQKNMDYKEILREYSRLFLKGTIPTTETAVCEKMNCVADVAAFYKAFGMNAKSGDSPDSIIYQLEFASLLCVKKVLAKDEEQSFIVEDAYQKFMDSHLTELGEKFHEKLQTAAPNEFYNELSNLLVTITKK